MSFALDIEKNQVFESDKVVVVENLKNYSKKWGNDWVEEMSGFVNKECVVLRIKEGNLLYLHCDGRFFSYTFPGFAVKLISYDLVPGIRAK